jgi:hypothetical protein
LAHRVHKVLRAQPTTGSIHTTTGSIHTATGSIHRFTRARKYQSDVSVSNTPPTLHARSIHRKFDQPLIADARICAPHMPLVDETLESAQRGLAHRYFEPNVYVRER